MPSTPTATTDCLPNYLAPLPRQLENLALRYAWLIVIINLAGTAFGFWYYRFQLAQTPLVMWPFVPDSPAATLLVALSLAAWKLDLDIEWLHMLAFFGNIKLGLWTPFVQLFLNGPGGIEPWLYWFLIVSHLAMSLQSFLIYRYAEFSVGAVAVATVWYGFNDIVDYFVPLVGEFHHTFLRAELVDGTLNHALRAHDLAAAAAVTLTLVATFLALATRVKKIELQRSPAPEQRGSATDSNGGGVEP
ncbi:DUF1405 domain-containing protein [Halobellus ordinarius]|uniref:DUF1405 domain-containing protein n=1 Tax=Halobellus ordinarius TaxID=3075120 RepID=UPI0031F32AFB